MNINIKTDVNMPELASLLICSPLAGQIKHKNNNLYIAHKHTLTRRKYISSSHKYAIHTRIVPY